MLHITDITCNSLVWYRLKQNILKKTLVCFRESIKGSMVDCLMPLKNAINKIYVKEGLLVYMLTVGR